MLFRSKKWFRPNFQLKFFSKDFSQELNTVVRKSIFAENTLSGNTRTDHGTRSAHFLETSASNRSPRYVVKFGTYPQRSKTETGMVLWETVPWYGFAAGKANLRHGSSCHGLRCKCGYRISLIIGWWWIHLLRATMTSKKNQTEFHPPQPNDLLSKILILISTEKAAGKIRLTKNDSFPETTFFFSISFNTFLFLRVLIRHNQSDKLNDKTNYRFQTRWPVPPAENKFVWFVTILAAGSKRILWAVLLEQ